MNLPPALAAKCLDLAGAPPGRSKRPPGVAAVAPAWALAFTVACVVVSEPNRRDHWAARRRRFRDQAAALADALRRLGLSDWAPPLPAAVTLTRLGGRGLDDDNLAGAFKGLRDALAGGWLRVDDADPRVRWAYAQSPGGPCGVRVAVSGR